MVDRQGCKDVYTNIWRYGWPPLCMMGLVGNTLVLLVLRRDGLVRTSTNVYLSALAFGDSLVLQWRFIGPAIPVDWCVSSPGPFYTLANASTWFIVAFTVERCVLVRFPLLKLRLCTPRNAGLCCGSLLVLAFVKNIDLFFINDLVFAFVVCVFPAHIFYVTIPNWPMPLQVQFDIRQSLLLLRYANHAVNFFLYSLTGAHFRCQLVALFRSFIQIGRVTAGVVRRVKSRVTDIVHYRRELDHHFEIHYNEHC
ncbi:hypothetical protein NP493_1608g00028 [Ridgeia piscesae]|uniref:G-protein coupled receptors family 1 profile domain-containing protein n=1 Tax=Ridgeia piscesae TaxID=27915 RepID=A0AAD9JXS9_RIDPI|nr:hypothetical protein NP493_1608g00028 [Ridgeia piscesae]